MPETSIIGLCRPGSLWVPMAQVSVSPGPPATHSASSLCVPGGAWTSLKSPHVLGVLTRLGQLVQEQGGERSSWPPEPRSAGPP